MVLEATIATKLGEPTLPALPVNLTFVKEVMMELLMTEDMDGDRETTFWGSVELITREIMMVVIPRSVF